MLTIIRVGATYVELQMNTLCNPRERCLIHIGRCQSLTSNTLRYATLRRYGGIHLFFKFNRKLTRMYYGKVITLFFIKEYELYRWDSPRIHFFRFMFFDI